MIAVGKVKGDSEWDIKIHKVFIKGEGQVEDGKVREKQHRNKKQCYLKNSIRRIKGAKKSEDHLRKSLFAFDGPRTCKLILMVLLRLSSIIPKSL